MKKTAMNRDVAQICNLLYRRFAIGMAAKNPGALTFSRPAGCKPAIQQIANLRYEESYD